MITQEYLKSILEYDPRVGIFIWKKPTGKSISIGSVAGNLSPIGYMRIGIDCRRYYVHRLAWLYMTGDFPNDEIDHINRRRDDNRWENLRECTSSQNAANAPMRKHNTSGFKGVSWSEAGNKWSARIGVGGKSVFLGLYDIKEAAAHAYNTAALKLYGNFSCLNKRI